MKFQVTVPLKLRTTGRVVQNLSVCVVVTAPYMTAAFRKAAVRVRRLFRDYVPDDVASLAEIVEEAK